MENAEEEDKHEAIQTFLQIENDEFVFSKDVYDAVHKINPSNVYKFAQALMELKPEVSRTLLDVLAFEEQGSTTVDYRKTKEGK